MTELHLRQPGFTYSAFGPFTKNKETIQKFKEAGDSRHSYQNELDKICFEYDMAYGNFKDLTRRTVLLLKVVNMIDIKKVLPQWFIHFLIKRLLVVLLKVRICQTSN